MRWGEVSDIDKFEDYLHKSRTTHVRIYTDTNMILEVLYERGATSIIFDNDGNYVDIQWGEYDDDKTTN